MGSFPSFDFFNLIYQNTTEYNKYINFEYGPR